MESKNKKIKASKKTLLDKQFLTAIQPQGGICFKDKYVKKGDGYEACIHVWNYPSNVNIFWLNQVMSMYDMTVVADIGTMEQDETISAINKNMVEQDVRFRSAKKESDRIDADRGYQEVESLYRQISQTGEVIKLFQLRLFLAAPDIEELDKKVKRTMSKLHALGFKGQIFLNETYYEWQSLFLPYDKQTELPNKREGKGIPAITLAAGLPYDFSELNDRTGSYLGSSSTGGNVMFDLFHSDKLRRFYNGVVIGKMGAGKSTALKKLLMDNEARGNFIRGFDVTGEFKTLINALGGKTISLDGSDGIINPLQIYRSDDTSNYIQGQASFEQYERQCFMQHISKVAIFYEFLAGNPSKKEIEEFKKLLRMFYESFGFMEKLKSEGVTTLNNEAYPVFNDLLIFIREQLYDNPEKRIIRSELSVSRVDRLEKIELVIDNLVNSYGTLFNGHTTLEDITNEQVIFFSIRNLTKLEKNVFHAQMYNTLNLIWDNLIQIGGPQKDQLYQDEAFDADDATRFLIMIDEAHRLVNADNMLAVSFLTDFAREARKYFGGMLLASQSIRDFVPDHKNTDTVTKIRTLFELTQYKFVMQQDSNTLDSLRTIFEGQLTESELEHVPQLQQGECILSISGVSNIMMTIEASEEELKLFEGGL